ncbi:LOW QUALITY PROTEIN: hypothetical protein PHPALM_37814 [Phytophthora palmivora]|uniref:HTH CENPB-type domain-containing protein n=1 Tax=Phytophthora palmivora TaxID=4796 RepID=A0A2P4WWG9_9STRA|nr:LOW QUALITY PROTEIN: hypothetical protein PHPALM_37814 [Phytophthora palmivora]
MLATSRRAGKTATEKLAVLDAWEQSGNIGAVLQAFYSELNEHAREKRRKLIYQWRKKRSDIELACQSARWRAKKKARQSGTGTVLPPEAEHELVVRINELRGEGVPISAVMLHLQALEVGAAYNKPDFRASWSWMKRFKICNKLSMRVRTRQGQTSPDDLDRIAANFRKSDK